MDDRYGYLDSQENGKLKEAGGFPQEDALKGMLMKGGREEQDDMSFDDAGTDNVQDETDKRCYTVEDLQNILMCGRAAVYELLKRNEFRYVRLGGSGYRISRRSFDEWLDKLV